MMFRWGRVVKKVALQEEIHPINCLFFNFNYMWFGRTDFLFIVTEDVVEALEGGAQTEASQRMLRDCFQKAQFSLVHTVA